MAPVQETQRVTSPAGVQTDYDHTRTYPQSTDKDQIIPLGLCRALNSLPFIKITSDPVDKISKEKPNALKGAFFPENAESKNPYEQYSGAIGDRKVQCGSITLSSIKAKDLADGTVILWIKMPAESLMTLPADFVPANTITLVDATGKTIMSKSEENKKEEISYENNEKVPVDIFVVISPKAHGLTRSVPTKIKWNGVEKVVKQDVYNLVGAVAGAKKEISPRAPLMIDTIQSQVKADEDAKDPKRLERMKLIEKNAIIDDKITSQIEEKFKLARSEIRSLNDILQEAPPKRIKELFKDEELKIINASIADYQKTHAAWQIKKMSNMIKNLDKNHIEVLARAKVGKVKPDELKAAIAEEFEEQLRKAKELLSEMRDIPKDDLKLFFPKDGTNEKIEFNKKVNELGAATKKLDDNLHPAPKKKAMLEPEDRPSIDYKKLLEQYADVPLSSGNYLASATNLPLQAKNENLIKPEKGFNRGEPT